MDYMDSLPDYAVVNNSVELAKTINKGAYKGFVNAVLKRAATEKISLPDGDGTYALSIKYGYPEWAINKIFSEYGREKGKEIVAAKKRGGTHVRTNGLIYSDESLNVTLKTPAINLKNKDGLLRFDESASEKIVYRRADYLSVADVDVCRARA